jgi:hypothetical protein
MTIFISHATLPSQNTSSALCVTHAFFHSNYSRSALLVSHALSHSLFFQGFCFATGILHAAFLLSFTITSDRPLRLNRSYFKLS